jgi:TolB-like protein
MSQIHLVIGEFINESDQFYLNQWEKTVPDLLQTKLSNSPDLVILERRKLKAVLEEKALALTGLMDSTTAREVGTLLEAEYVIFGSIHYVDEHYRIDASVVNVQTGQIRAEKVVSPDQKQLSKMIDLLGDNILFNLTGKGNYKQTMKISSYPTKYFLAATVVMGATTLWVNNEYQKKKDEYNNNTELDRFDDLYNDANRAKKATVVLATLTGTALAGTIYFWVKGLSPKKIYAWNHQAGSMIPYFTINLKNEVQFGVQIHY